MYNIVEKATRLQKSQIEYTIDQAKSKQVDSYATLNISILAKTAQYFKQTLPEVVPYYIMQANPHKIVLETIASQNININCNQLNEVKQALQFYKPQQIFIANPTKSMEFITYCLENEINLFHFDCEKELEKIVKTANQLNKHVKLVLKLIPGQQTEVSQGATKEQAIRLFKLINELNTNKNIELVGLGFMPGMHFQHTSDYKSAIEYCGQMADIAKQNGHEISILNIGDGLMTEGPKQHEISVQNADGSLVLRDNSVKFEQFAEQIKQSIKEVRNHFVADGRFSVICQLGRFLVADCMTQCLRVFGRRILFDYTNCKLEDIKNDPTTEEELMKVRKITEVKYYVGDGVYGYFNCIAFDHVQPKLQYIRDGKQIVEKEYESHIFGPTCDSMDNIRKHLPVPLLKVSDWVVVESFGAYTNAGACEFNGIPLTQIEAVY